MYIQKAVTRMIVDNFWRLKVPGKVNGMVHKTLHAITEEMG